MQYKYVQQNIYYRKTVIVKFSSHRSYNQEKKNKKTETENLVKLIIIYSIKYENELSERLKITINSQLISYRYPLKDIVINQYFFFYQYIEQIVILGEFLYSSSPTPLLFLFYTFFLFNLYRVHLSTISLSFMLSFFFSITEIVCYVFWQLFFSVACSIEI